MVISLIDCFRQYVAIGFIPTVETPMEEFGK